MKAGSQRSGLTLLEVMIVLAISVSLLAIAWPRVRRLTERSALKQAALEVKAALAEARERAIRQGTEVAISYVPNASRFSIAMSSKEQTDHRDASRLENSQNRLMQDEENPAVSIASRSKQSLIDVRSLPDDVVFMSQVQGIDRDLVTVQPELSQPDPQSAQLPEQFIRFFADGRANSATIQLFSPELSRSISIEVRGLTGGTKIGSVERSVQKESDEPTIFAPSETGQLP